MLTVWLQAPYVVDCDIDATEARDDSSAVVVQNRAAPTFHRSHLHGGKRAGMVAMGHATPTFRQSYIRHNGIELSAPSYWLALKCVSHAGMSGLEVHGNPPAVDSPHGTLVESWRSRMG